MTTVRIKNIQHRLERIAYCMAICQQDYPLHYLYLQAIIDLKTLKDYCTVDMVSYLFDKDYRIVIRDLKDMDRKGWVAYDKKRRIVAVTSKGREVLDPVDHVKNEIFYKLIEDKRKVKRVEFTKDGRV